MLARLAITPQARPDATARGPVRKGIAPHAPHQELTP